MDAIQNILVVVLAIVIFIIIHKIFHITYFGWKGMFMVFLISLAISALILHVALSFIASYYGWLIAAAVVFIVIFALRKRKSVSTSSDYTTDE